MQEGLEGSAGGGSGSRHLAAWSALLAVTVALALSAVAGGPRELARLLAEADPRRLALAAGLILAAEALRAVRLVLVTRRMGGGLRFRHALAARLLGKFAGLATPAGIASAPTRAALVGAYTGLHVGSALGAATLEGLADSLTASLVALATALPLLPRSALVVLLSLLTSALWLTGVLAASRDGLAERVYERLRLPARLRCMIELHRRLYVEALAQVRQADFSAYFALLTVAAYMVEAFSVVAAKLGPQALGSGGLYLLPAALGGVAATYVAIIFPTPGGSGAVEFSLSVYLDPHSLVTWRLAQLIVVLLPAALLLAAAPSLREYFNSEASLGVGGKCDGEPEDL
ncbi:lysylphosphatidylglycerol synthase transmembrane domain-containing protein [Stetteria hydrogenophila]